MGVEGRGGGGGGSLWKVVCRMGDLSAVWKDMEEGGEVHDNAWSLSPYSCSLPCVLTTHTHTHTSSHVLSLR